MRTLPLLIAVVVVSHVVTAADMKPADIIAKSEAAYAAVKSYEGTTTVRSKSEIGDSKLDQTATAKITFVRPGKMRIEGKDTGSRPYAIISDGKDTWRSWPLENAGAFKKDQSLMMAVATMTGVAGLAPTYIHSALMTPGAASPFAIGRTGTAKLMGHEKVDGADCHIVVADASSAKNTYWIDSATFLLRRMKEEQNEKQLAAASERAQEAMKNVGKGKNLPDISAMKLKSMERVHSFQIDRVNGTPDAKLFADPTKK